MDRHRVAIIVPAYNEEKTISSVIKSVSDYGIPIVIDDGSIDSTVANARTSGAIVISHATNYGYEVALNTGFKYASQEGFIYAITIDADGQHDSLLIDEFLNTLDRGADLVIGVRDRFQRFSELIFGVVANFFWGLSDPLCGMKGYRLKLFQGYGFSRVGTIGVGLPVYCKKNNKLVVQVPVKTKDRVDEPRFGDGLSANLRILMAMFRVLFGWY